MSLEVNNLLNGFEETTYLNTYLESTGDEPPCLHITPNSILPSSLGGITSDPLLSLTHYQWRELYAAWRLAIPSHDWQRILVFPQKGEPYILPMDWPSLTLRQNENLLSIASTTYISANKYSKDSREATLLRNYASST